MQLVQRSRTFLQRPNTSLEKLRQWKWAAIDLLAPPKCVGCGLTGSAWCGNCAMKTRLMDGPVCKLCGNVQEDESCDYCTDYASAFDKAFSYASYDDPFRRILLQMKYHNDPGLGALVARLIQDKVSDQAGTVDLLVPVPLGKARRASRGFNQVETFSRPLAALLGAWYAPDALQRALETRSQVGLSGIERRENLAGAFLAQQSIVVGQRVLLTDDVFTTGATGNACARALKEAGAASVIVFTLARALESKEVRMEIA